MITFLKTWVMVIMFVSSILASDLSPGKKVTCDSATNFHSDAEKAEIQGAKWTIIQNSDKVVADYSKKQPFIIMFANSTVEFEGYLVSDSEPSENKTKITWRSNGNAVGIAAHSDQGNIKNCQILLWENPYHGSAKMEVEIHNQAEICLESYLCGHKLKDFAIDDAKHTEINLNMLVDLALQRVIKVLQKNSGDTVPIPDLRKDFGWIGYFEATGGKFRDITSLKRTSNAIISSEGNKYSGTCGFGFNTAIVHFDHYKLKWGASVSGSINLDIRDVALEVEVEVDYDQRPCVATLKRAKITNLGAINVQLTGLGVMSTLSSKLITFVTNHWRGAVVSEIENILKDAAQKQLNEIKYEEFRPN